MALVKKIKNTSGGLKTYRGQEIANGAYYEIPLLDEEDMITCPVLAADIAAGDALINDGTTDLNATDSQTWLECKDASCIAGVHVDDASIADGKVLEYNSTSGKLEYVTPSTGVYGTEFYWGESNGISATTSTSWQQKLRLTTSSLPAGDYKVEWYGEQSSDKTSVEVRARVQINDSITCVDLYRQYPVNDEYYDFAGMCFHTLSAGVKNIDLDYCTEAGSGAGSKIKNVRLSIVRVS